MKEISLSEDEQDAIEDYLEFTPTQLKAISSLKRAFTRCKKLGLEFWDNYGTFTVFDSHKMTQPIPDEIYEYPLNDIYKGTIEITEAGDTSGNADDPLWFDLKKPLPEIAKKYKNKWKGEI